MFDKFESSQMAKAQLMMVKGGTVTNEAEEVQNRSTRGEKEESEGIIGSGGAGEFD